jgi:hypothetical protein
MDTLPAYLSGVDRKPDLNANLKTLDSIVLCAVLSWFVSGVYIKRKKSPVVPVQ